MANLTKFVWSGARPGMKFDMYEYRTRIRIPGEAEILALTPLHLHVKGYAQLVVRIEGEIEIIMPDEAPSGVCSVAFNGERRDNVPYATVGNTLVIRDPRVKIELDTERKYSWVGVDRPINAKVGLWPQGQKIEMD
ncbi:MAG: hypothetical protein AB8B56_20690 [Crocinitomicaceae bacterium]